MVKHQHQQQEPEHLDALETMYSSDCKNKTILIIGPSHSGKTKLCRDFLKGKEDKKQMVLLTVLYEDLESHSDFVELVNNFLTTPRIGDSTIKDKVVFFDDVDILLSQDRYANTFIQSIISTPSLCLLLTCSVSEERRVTEIKKKCELMIRLEKNQTLNDKHGFKDDLFNPYFDMNIYQLVDTVFANPNGDLQDLELGIYSDPTLINFIMYDNYINVFNDLYCEVTHEVTQKINRSFALTSLLEDHAYLTNDHSLVELLSLVRCHTIRCCQRGLEPKAKDEVSKPKQHQIVYTQIASRSAQHHSVTKKHMTIDLTPTNISLIAEMKHGKKEKVSPKTTLGAVCQAYIYNICKK